ncbi:conserved hypothetical protein [uncultured Dysgonomonas sp.]|uniref:DUF2851 domain-containing protein n=1 Tax=uncultured Dysgonomonas sp. TaxID=206096 RepID=A0A212JGE9_9BACT|nr:DUF2851 family protein [uncultured Dysgonomonas sp.]SBV98494.1 conserved hypothetical protein [uncultured Dysgonomonas sp.]
MEDILHYIWKFKLYQKELKTTDGRQIEVLDVGLPNTNEGPDYFNAKIKIDGELWAGNIEIHTSSDQWKAHNHHKNKSYNSVILHVVEKANCEVFNELGQSVIQCEITYPQHIKENYDFLIHSNTDIPCRNYIGNVPPFHLNSWMNTLLIERLERKANHIESLLKRFQNSWEDTFYVLLTRNFGFGLNSDSFERLALSLPLRCIQKQGDNIIQIEALLFGQAGMLDNVKVEDDYFSLLKKEYEFLKNKYDLKPLDSYIFKSMRSRPTAFPQIRIAQLASLLHSSHGLFSKITACDDIGRIRLMFHVNASEYWQTHYAFGVTSERKSKYLGDSSLDILLINTVAPILFIYGKSIDNETLCERALKFLEMLKPEQNSITKLFSKLKMPLNSAADSQAMIQLKREYCELRKCLFCRIGHQLLVEK